MPTTREPGSEDSISVTELLYRIRAEPAVFREFLRTEQLAGLVNRGRIPRARLALVLERYAAWHGLIGQRWDLPDWLLADRRPWSATLRGMYAEPVAFPASLPPSQGRQVFDLILRERPERVVEIGCFAGISTLWIAAALQTLGRGHLYSVDLFLDRDPYPPYHYGYLHDPCSYVRRQLDAAGLGDRVTLVKASSASFPQQLPEPLRSGIDFLFIDGDHSIGGCVDDLLSYYPLVPTGGRILLHDINPQQCGWRGPRWLLTHVLADRRLFDVCEIPTEPDFGMAIATKLRDSRRLHPWRDPRLETLRQLQRIKTALRQSTFYRLRLKPAYLSLLFHLRKLKRYGHRDHV